MNINYSEDSEDDVVKLKNPRLLKHSVMANVVAYGGYKLEDLKGDIYRGHNTKTCFANYIKELGSISNDDLKTLIEKTYPDVLKNSNVLIIFAMGSSSAMSINIAEALKELYYPNAKIVDIIKAYYGKDPDNMVDWGKYNKTDKATKSAIDAFVNKHKSSSKNNIEVKAKREFSGFIKKSAGLQSGPRYILKPGHLIDLTILKSIQDTFMSNRDATYLTVDDIILKGSTMRSALENVVNAVISDRDIIRNSDDKKKVIHNLKGYVMFSLMDRFKPVYADEHEIRKREERNKEADISRASNKLRDNTIGQAMHADMQSFKGKLNLKQSSIEVYNSKVERYGLTMDKLYSIYKKWLKQNGYVDIRYWINQPTDTGI